MERACRDCQWFDPYAMDDYQGQCRAGLPITKGSSEKGIWPVVGEDDWCARFSILIDHDSTPPMVGG